MPVLDSPQTLLAIETRWAMLPPPPDPSHPEYESRWRYLFEVYTPAMRRYVSVLVRGLYGPNASLEAEDIVHAYLTSCLEKGWLSRDSSEIHSFRRYLKTQLFRFTCDTMDRANAKKRKPPVLENPEVLKGVRARVLDPAELALDQALVEIAVERAIAVVSKSNADHGEVLRDLLRTSGEGSSDLGERLDRGAPQLRVLRHRARKAFAAELAAELKDTVRSPDDFAELLDQLTPHLP